MNPIRWVEGAEGTFRPGGSKIDLLVRCAGGQVSLLFYCFVLCPIEHTIDTTSALGIARVTCF